MEKQNDSHISTGAKAETPSGPLNQHKRLALGESVSGQSNPNGASPNTRNLIAGQSKQY